MIESLSLLSATAQIVYMKNAELFSWRQRALHHFPLIFLEMNFSIFNSMQVLKKNPNFYLHSDRKISCDGSLWFCKINMEAPSSSILSILTGSNWFTSSLQSLGHRPPPGAAQQIWSSVVQDECNQPCRMLLSCEAKEGTHLWSVTADNRHLCDISLGNRSVSLSGHKSVSRFARAFGIKHKCVWCNVSSSVIV